MSSNTTTSTSYDEERRILGMLTEAVEEPEFDGGSDAESESESVLERLIDLLSLQDDDVDTASNATHPSLVDQEALEWERNMLATPLATFLIHAERTPVQAVRPTEHLRAVPAPNCWIGLSVGWPETDVSMEVFGMAHWSHIPWVSVSCPYMLPQNIYARTHLGSLNGVPEYDIAEPGSLLYPDSLLLLP